MPNYFLITVWIAQIIIALILLQTLYFKFTGAEESKFIFSKIGVEPWGRYFIATAELTIAVLLLIPTTSKYASIGAMAIILPAIFFHLTILGIEVMNDKGLLFGLAILIFVLSAFVTWARFAKL
ncbi:DoxX family protein [Candidatus Pacearchaeota archaeon CG10_big_fil_rev_8_21_14_0_10_34_76]|nr:MAG: DoxX family protein [Candidatus Pacearchaeota archaeon CG10_big_fil_rev_8_21_14_0_10_34_76]